VVLIDEGHVETISGHCSATHHIFNLEDFTRNRKYNIPNTQQWMVVCQYVCRWNEFVHSMCRAQIHYFVRSENHILYIGMTIGGDSPPS